MDRGDEAPNDLRIAGDIPLAAGVGFEPTGHLTAANDFQDRPVRPLRHPAGTERNARPNVGESSVMSLLIRSREAAVAIRARAGAGAATTEPVLARRGGRVYAGETPGGTIDEAWSRTMPDDRWKLDLRRRTLRAVNTQLPTGTVTFLFTDIEGSTRLLHEFGERYAEVLEEHRRVLRDAVAAHRGFEVDTQGDAFFVAFARASDAIAAAAEAQQRLADGPVRVRMGLHIGEPICTEEGYAGVDVHRAARICAAGHGGQIVVSEAMRALMEGSALRDLGEHRLKDLTEPQRLYQLGSEEFPPLKTLHQTNLPVPATPFLGRERELGEVLGHLRSSRLLTLTGAGGSGKTRLAAQAAAEAAEDFPGGVWWVSLAALLDPAFVLDSIAQVLGATGELPEHIADNRLLLLLDNLERRRQGGDHPPTRDGKKIVFMSGRDGTQEIYVMNPDGSAQTRVTGDAFNDAQPAWSPDGKKIVFTSAHADTADLYSINVDGSGQTRLTQDPASESPRRGGLSSPPRPLPGARSRVPRARTHCAARRGGTSSAAWLATTRCWGSPVTICSRAARGTTC